MEVSLLNVKITFQKNTVAVDGIGNHRNTWTDYYSCHATVSGEAGKQTSQTWPGLWRMNRIFRLLSAGAGKRLRLIPRDTGWYLAGNCTTSSLSTT